MMFGRTLLVMAVGGLLVSAAGTVFAARPDDAGSRRNADATTTGDGHGPPDREARRAAMESFRENMTRIQGEYRDTLMAIRESWQENRTRVVDDCRSEDTNGPRNASFDWANASKDEKLAFAHCIRDGLRLLRTEARIDAREARTVAMEELHAARRAAFDALGTETTAETSSDDGSDDAADASSEEAADDTSGDESTSGDTSGDTSDDTADDTTEDTSDDDGNQTAAA